MIYIIIAILSGVTIVVSRSVNYVLAEKIGMYQSTFFNYVFGLIGSFLLLIIGGEIARLSSPETYSAVWFVYTGGFIGVVSVTLSSFLSPRVSSFYLTLLTFIGQLFTGVLIDYIVDGHMSVYKVLGGILVVIGLGYNMIVDKKKTL